MGEPPTIFDRRDSRPADHAASRRKREIWRGVRPRELRRPVEDESGSDSAGLVDPEVPCDRADLLVFEGQAGDLERQLDLAVMVALVPDHVLHEEQWMIVVHLHGLAGAETVLHRVTHGARALIEPGCDAFGVSLTAPFTRGAPGRRNRAHPRRGR